MSWCIKAVILSIFLLPLPGVSETQKGEQTPEETPYTISLNVDLVVLDVSVTDKNGTFMPGLQAHHFKVFEDGRDQEIKSFFSKDVPITVGLVIDNSGSVRRNQTAIVAAGMSFVASSNPKDEMFVVHFNENVQFGLDTAVRFTNSRALLSGALRHMVGAGRTALYDAVAQSIEHLSNGKHGRRALLIISDGGDNASHRDLKETLATVQSSKTVLYTISLSDPANRDQKPGILRRLARTSGGQSFFPRELGEVAPICQKIANEIRNQYVLVYQPTNTRRDGTFRRIRVAVEAPSHKRLTVRTREGYIAPRDSDSRHESINNGTSAVRENQVRSLPIDPNTK
jgi:Ca-activated chloride channel family protein